MIYRGVIVHGVAGWGILQHLCLVIEVLLAQIILYELWCQEVRPQTTGSHQAGLVLGLSDTATGGLRAEASPARMGAVRVPAPLLAGRTRVPACCAQGVPRVRGCWQGSSEMAGPAAVAAAAGPLGVVSQRPAAAWHVEINRRIARCRSAAEVLDLCGASLQDFNEVNIATALHRVARLGAGHRRGD
ncbi:unnamed protein product [Prorocentrum cordatum]|uniref:Uncharacterized protein n=1 Tax=Prorocentrum cordatum TaxID=2364126 RepID=A0ABN9PM96_9DINO|nr:unnamed protein product [Polarella glacialis]